MTTTGPCLIVAIVRASSLVEETVVVATRLGRPLLSSRRMRPLVVDVTSPTPIAKTSAASPQAIVA